MRKISIFIFVINCLLSYSQIGWQQVNPGFGHVYYSVHFTDSNTGMACGLNGAIIMSTNSGINWVNQNSGTSISLYDIKMFTPLIAIAVGDQQLILRTTNGGINWSIINQGTIAANSIRNLNIHNGVQATAYSNYYSSPYEYTYVYKSTNSGLDWNIQQVYVANRWIHFIDINTGWANGSTYTGPPLYQYYLDVNKTTNGGTNWSLIYRSSGLSINPGLIYFFNSSIGFKFSHIGIIYLYRSLDGGNSWISSPGLPPNYTNMIRCFYLVNQQTGWFAGDNSTIFRTTNTGSVWVQQTSPASANLQKVYFINENTGWIAASAAGILKTTTGGYATGIHQISNEIPNSYILFQNYPNPFNPTTKISFSIPLSRGVSADGGRGVLVKLKIFDILGREVSTLVNESLKPGTYEVEFDGSSFASGVYFYSLITNEFTETKKLILLK